MLSHYEMSSHYVKCCVASLLHCNTKAMHHIGARWDGAQWQRTNMVHDGAAHNDTKAMHQYGARWDGAQWHDARVTDNATIKTNNLNNARPCYPILGFTLLGFLVVDILSSGGTIAVWHAIKRPLHKRIYHYDIN